MKRKSKKMIPALATFALLLLCGQIPDAVAFFSRKVVITQKIHVNPAQYELTSAPLKTPMRKSLLSNVYSTDDDTRPVALFSETSYFGEESEANTGNTVYSVAPDTEVVTR